MGKITTVLFDLDGTLIGMDQDEFVKEYFSSIIEHLSSLGYDAPTAERALYGAVRAIFANDGKITNEQCFSRAFLDGIGGYTDTLDPLDDYYNGAFVEVISTTCYEYPRAREVLERVKNKGLRAVLATNPLFPEVATIQRMAIGGLYPRDFEYITTYENRSYAKPSPEYFRELLDKLGLSADECVMIGNDTRDDMSATTLGIPVFFLTDGLINKSGVDISDYSHGSFDELIDFIDHL